MPITEPEPLKACRASTIGAILIGGRSSRMGTDKAMLRLRDGRTMMQWVGAALESVCDSIVVVGRVDSEGDALRQFAGVEFVRDARDAAGPLGGIEALLMSNRADEYLVCPCDVPRITSETLRLLRQYSDAPATVLRVEGSRDFEPLPARIASCALPTVRRLLDAGERAVRKLMKELPAAIIEIEAHHMATLLNVNTPDDRYRL